MAVSVLGVSGLAWTPLDSAGRNLIAQIELKFDVYDGYDIVPTGNFRAGVPEAANGVVFDNLENAGFLNIGFDAFSERVPPFSKGMLILPAQTQRVRAGMIGGTVYATFFKGAYPGTANGVNFLGALRSAQQGT